MTIDKGHKGPLTPPDLQNKILTFTRLPRSAGSPPGRLVKAEAELSWGAAEWQHRAGIGHAVRTRRPAGGCARAVPSNATRAQRRAFWLPHCGAA